jgi:hypothetical protein
MTNLPASATTLLRPTLAEAALYGLPGDIARAVSKQTGGDPAQALLSTLTRLGNAVGRQPHIRFGNAQQAARHFVLIVGDSSSLKDTVEAAVDDLFAQADPDWHASRIKSGLQSPEAMIELVADGPTGDSRLLNFESEIRRLVAQMARSANFGPVLRQGYDGQPLEISRSRGGRSDDRSIRSSYPHISLIALVTPEELIRIYLQLVAAGGLENRFFYVLVARQGDVNPFAPPDVDNDTLVARLRSAIESSRARVLEQTDPVSRALCIMRGVQPRCEMPLTPALRNQWPEIRDQLPQVKPEFQHLVRRAPTHVARFALTYAIGDESDAIGVEHVNAALALCAFGARSAERIFGVPTGTLQPQVDPQRRGKVFVYLASEGGWVSREQISRDHFRGNLPKRDLDAIVGSLIDDGHIEYRKVPTSGRPRIEYRVVQPAPTLSP